MQKPNKTLNACILYIAALSGVGYSSGQEIRIFFVRYGRFGLVTLSAVPIILFSVSLIFILTSRKKALSGACSIFIPDKHKYVEEFVNSVIFLVMVLGVVLPTWHFGYKAHIGVDKDSGVVHTVKATAANVHDVSETSKLLTGEEAVVYGDSGYLGAGKREDAIVRNKSGHKIRYKINRRPSQVKKLSKSGRYAAKKAEHAKSSIRAKVEHVFGVVKKQLRFRKTRYRGLEKQQAKFNIMFALANLILADRPCLAA